MSTIYEWFHHNDLKPIQDFFTKPIRRQTNKNSRIYYRSKQRGGIIGSEH